MIKENDITPVENINGLYLKRDDLYKPFGDNTVNGGKLRQCYYLIDSIKDKYEGVISCCSLYSPQAPITAAVAKHFNLKCIICYGGTKKERLGYFRMPSIVRHYKADIRIISKSGIHKILYNKAKVIAKEKNYFVVDYGFNIIDYPDILLNAVSTQVQNIPDNLNNIVITCGSGITTCGILIGIKKYKKHIKNIYLVCTAPSRNKLIDKTMRDYKITGLNIIYIDLFHKKGFSYEKGLLQEIQGIKLHPNYEAKAYYWLKNNIDYKKEKTLLWIVGSKPMR